MIHPTDNINRIIAAMIITLFLFMTAMAQHRKGPQPKRQAPTGGQVVNPISELMAKARDVRTVKKAGPLSDWRFIGFSENGTWWWMPKSPSTTYDSEWGVIDFKGVFLPYPFTHTKIYNVEMTCNGYFHYLSYVDFYNDKSVSDVHPLDHQWQETAGTDFEKIRRLFCK